MEGNDVGHGESGHDSEPAAARLESGGAGAAHAKAKQYTAGVGALRWARSAFRRALGAIRSLAAWVVRFGGAARRHWRFGWTLLAAALLILTTLWLRLEDASARNVLDERGLAAVGVYSSSYDMLSLFRLKPGVSDWPAGWTFRATPGEPWKGSVTWVGLSSHDHAQLDLREPLSILIALPNGARLTSVDPLRVGYADACATWFDGEEVGGQERLVVESPAFGSVFVGCEIPAVGEIDDLFIEVDFEWTSEVRAAAGYGRQRDAIRFPVLSPWMPSDAEGILPLAIEELQYRTARQPLDFTLELPTGERLLEAFPAPVRGALQERTWEVGHARGDDLTEIELTLENTGDRVWVQPAAEISLVLVGVLLGLLPLAWVRGRRPEQLENSEKCGASSES